MSLELRILIVGLAAFAAAGVIAALVVPAAAGFVTRGSAAVRARRLASLRMFPSAVAAVAGLAVVSAFLIFEPRQDDEYMGAVLPAFAGFGLLLLAGSLWRAHRLAQATRALDAQWMATAEPVALAGISVPAFAVDADFPIVAVVGWRRPRLLIAKSVLASCSTEELTAVLAHEQGHVNRRDNLRRLMLAVAPDVLAWLPASERLLNAWREAAEDAADDDAAKSGADGRWRLASALVKVARLAPGCSAANVMPASTLYNGVGLDRRVRRLINPDGPVDRTCGDRRGSVRGWTLAGSGVVAGALALESVHSAVEAVIHLLP